MAWCAVVGCTNSNKKNPDKTFFALPKEESLKKQWVQLINRTELPRNVFVCSDHFEESSFDPSWALQNSLFYKDRPRKRKLLPGSLPTVFPHKQKVKRRESTLQRLERKCQKEVRNYFKLFRIFLNFVTQNNWKL